jgi:hypothetical protein
MSAFNEAARGLSVGDTMETRFNAIPVGANLAEAIETLLATAQHEFPVVDAFGKPVGLLLPSVCPRRPLCQRSAPIRFRRRMRTQWEGGEAQPPTLSSSQPSSQPQRRRHPAFGLKR